MILGSKEYSDDSIKNTVFCQIGSTKLVLPIRPKYGILNRVIRVPFCDEKSVQLVRVASLRSDFFKNPYFSASSQDV